MDSPAVIAIGVGVILAAANGSNDLSKGVASLAGAGLADYRKALAWGTIWSLAGGIAAAIAGTEMVNTFLQAFVSSSGASGFSYGVAILLGASAWVVLATILRLPVSTTHALVGAGLGVSACVYGPDGVRWGILGPKVALPLLVSPAAAFLIAAAWTLPWKARARRSRITEAECLCVEARPVVLAAASTHCSVAVATAIALEAQVGSVRECAEEHRALVRLDLDKLHWLGSGLASFARAANDVPKMVALVIGAAALSGTPEIPPVLIFLTLTLAMIAGGLLGGYGVTRALAEDVTQLDHRTGLAASLVTAVLVTAGAALGLPMSTTHVSTAAIAGTGEAETRRETQRRMIRRILAAWVVTLPGAAVLGAGCFWFVSTADLLWK